MTEARGVGKVLVIIPTYNEIESLPHIVRGVREVVPDAHVLVADDNSPDRTGKLADQLAAEDDHVHVLHRTSKNGLGAAYLAGFRWGMTRGYDVLVEMDADGSHRPEHLPTMLDALRDADAVIGSRWVPGGGVVNWPKSGLILRQGGNRCVAFMLGLGVRDAT
jgi:dolichol-phosphate mannosyltransferase